MTETLFGIIYFTLTLSFCLAYVLSANMEGEGFNELYCSQTPGGYQNYFLNNLPLKIFTESIVQRKLCCLRSNIMLHPHALMNILHTNSCTVIVLPWIWSYRKKTVSNPLKIFFTWTICNTRGGEGARAEHD